MSDRTIYLLDEDPELGGSLAGPRQDAARRELICLAKDLPRGELPSDYAVEETDGALGLLVLDGLLSRRVSVAGRRCLELLGEGDVLRPWQNDGHHMVAPFEAQYTALVPTRVAVLDRRAAARIGRWPEVMDALMGRIMNRSRALAGHLVLAQMPRVDERLLVLMWHLADRWGRMTSDGVTLPLPLSHEMLGALIGAQRPTVSLALKQLTDRGLITRRPDRAWLLLEEPSVEVRDRASALSANPGDALAAS